MPKSKIVSSIIALVLGLCVVVFTIAYFSINGNTTERDIHLRATFSMALQH